MQLSIEVPLSATELFQKAAAYSTKLLSTITPHTSSILLSTTEDLFALPEKRGEIFRITEGVATLTVGGRRVITFEEGDLIGLEQEFGILDSKIILDFAIRVDSFKTESLLISAEPRPDWSHYLLYRFNGMLVAFASLVKRDDEFRPQVRTYAPNEVIIEQGTLDTKVFTLLRGHADVFVDGLKVGEILSDEIFGALAALTNMPRNASVIASQECLTLSLERTRFLELIQTRPETVLKMVEDMARTISSLNCRVVALEKGSAHTEGMPSIFPPIFVKG